jgi:hypothetical protein
MKTPPPVLLLGSSVVAILAASAMAACSGTSSGGLTASDDAGETPPAKTGSGDDSGGQGTGDDASGGGSTTDATTGGASDGQVEHDAAADAGHGHATDASTTEDASSTSPTDASGPMAPADAPGVLDDGGEDQQAWLVPMNAARSDVGEAALTWNPIAAQVALNYASQCNYEHNANRNADYKTLGGGNGGLGENIAAGAPTQTIAAAVGSWVGEKADYTYATNSCAAGDECGHYTQIVWKTTTSVGCAKVSCTVNSPFGTFSNGRWDYSVCDYSPPGNYVGESPY